MDSLQRICEQMQIPAGQVAAVLHLLNEGATVPFISRYRKEMTGGLDEVAIANIRDLAKKIEEMDKRREAIFESLIERDLLNDTLKQQLSEATSLSRLEDLYLPYRPKRKTRAMAAREKGLEPLARQIEDSNQSADVSEFVSMEKSVLNEDDALQGALDILAEEISENADTRQEIRTLFWEEALLESIVTEGMEENGSKFKDYFDWSELLYKAPPHRVLAMLRGQREGFLNLKARPDEESSLDLLSRLHLRSENPDADKMTLAIIRAYRRHLLPSLETEILGRARETADEQSIEVFADNVRELLMASPLGAKSVLAIDPGFRTGCKVVALDAQGNLLKNDTVYPGMGGFKDQEARNRLEEMLEKFIPDVIVVGNGTGGREVEAFVRGFSGKIPVVMISEAGASVYSASEIARREFPDFDVTVRGAVSIGRRLQDPLAELVKIDPKSIGVGQYQHDVNQTLLKQKLDDVVLSCVNAVGVELNNASEQLLSYVSGLGPSLAHNIVEYRKKQGAFKSRAELRQVPRLGEKAFEQAAGFLRIKDGVDPLDTSAVHPERYELVRRMAVDCQTDVHRLLADSGLRSKIDPKRYLSDTVGLPTIRDILKELEKPGRDPRSGFEVFQFDERVNRPEDLKDGMQLPGIVTNVADFGAFVDVGVHQDGLVHISQVADHFVKDIHSVIKVGQKVQVWVQAVDLKRGRISLSMLKNC